MVCIGTTFYLFIKKQSDERPNFVLWQMLFVNMYWIIFIIAMTYLALDGNDSDAGEIYSSLATMGDTCLLIHDWIFVDAYLVASLLLPIALQRFRNPSQDRARQSRA